MAKPIFIITVPAHMYDDVEFDKFKEVFNEKFLDYHVLFVSLPNTVKNITANIEFKVLAEKDYKEIDLQNITNSVKEVFKK